MTALGRLLLGAISIGVIGCAHEGQLNASWEANLETPEPDNSVCGSLAPDAAEVDVFVRDGDGSGLPRAAVYLFGRYYSEGAPEPLSPLGTYTNSRGHTLIRVEGGHDYRILVLLGGFVPAIRVFALKGGCSANVTIALRIAENDSLRSLNGQSKQ